MTKRSLPNSKYDGLTHINVYSKGKTKLGRLLSNFAHTPFDCDDGHFESVEGYWYWLQAEPIPEREELRNFSGYEAKELGKLMIDPDKVGEKRGEDFRKKILKAIWLKIHNNEHLKELITESILPFEHYYVYGDKSIQGGGQWIIEGLEKIRTHLQSNNE